MGPADVVLRLAGKLKVAVEPPTNDNFQAPLAQILPMKKYAEFYLLLLLAAMLAAVNYYLGHRALILAGVLSTVWFIIAFVLLSRPPGVPEFVSDEVGSDEQHVIRKDVIPRVPVQQRFRLSLSVACGSCLLLWLSLVLLAG